MRDRKKLRDRRPTAKAVTADHRENFAQLPRANGTGAAERELSDRAPFRWHAILKNRRSLSKNRPSPVSE
jgi:hypothetical protein